MVPCIFSTPYLCPHLFLGEWAQPFTSLFCWTGRSSLANMNPWHGQVPHFLMSCESVFKIKHFTEEQFVAKGPVNSSQTYLQEHQFIVITVKAKKSVKNSHLRTPVKRILMVYRGGGVGAPFP